MFKQDELNKYLDEITQKDVSKHETLLIDLKHRFHHSIKVISSQEYKGVKISDFMCYEFAFGLFNQIEYRSVLEYQRSWKLHPIGADEKFLLFLENNNSIKEIKLGDINDGDLIVYLKNNQYCHAGKLIKKRVISKWGKGLLLNHEINEVPAKYGNSLKYFRSIYLEDCINFFIDYAKARGIPFEEVNE